MFSKLAGAATRILTILSKVAPRSHFTKFEIEQNVWYQLLKRIKSVKDIQLEESLSKRACKDFLASLEQNNVKRHSLPNPTLFKQYEYYQRYWELMKATLTQAILIHRATSTFLYSLSDYLN